MVTDVLAKYRPIIEDKINQETEEGLETLKANGMKIIEPDIEAFKANAEKVVQEALGGDPEWAAAIKDLEDFKANWNLSLIHI